MFFLSSEPFCVCRLAKNSIADSPDDTLSTGKAQNAVVVISENMLGPVSGGEVAAETCVV